MWRGRSLTLVCGPAGYGKSTLLSSWVASCECPSAWLSLDEKDNDLRTFLIYVAAAVRTIVPGACSDLGKALQSEHLPSPGTLADILRTDLDQIGKELILVLDDFHIIREKAVHDLIREWIRPLRGAVHLALGTRHDPPLPLPSMRALNRIEEIRTRDLCFTHEETLAFLQKALDTGIDAELAAAFEGKTEGWVAGLRLIAGTLRHRKNPQEYIAGLMQDHRHIVDFLVAEVLANQPAHIEEFLLDTSVLERFCAPLCDALNPSGAQGLEPEKDGKGFIAWAERSNLFLIPLSGSKRGSPPNRPSPCSSVFWKL